jgi:hypothetical protein
MYDNLSPKFVRMPFNFVAHGEMGAGGGCQAGLVGWCRGDCDFHHIFGSPWLSIASPYIYIYIYI